MLVKEGGMKQALRDEHCWLYCKRHLPVGKLMREFLSDERTTARVSASGLEVLGLYARVCCNERAL